MQVRRRWEFSHLRNDCSMECLLFGGECRDLWSPPRARRWGVPAGGERGSFVVEKRDDKLSSPSHSARQTRACITASLFSVFCLRSLSLSLSLSPSLPLPPSLSLSLVLPLSLPLSPSLSLPLSLSLSLSLLSLSTSLSPSLSLSPSPLSLPPLSVFPLLFIL